MLSVTPVGYYSWGKPYLCRIWRICHSHMSTFGTTAPWQCVAYGPTWVTIKAVLMGMWCHFSHSTITEHAYNYKQYNKAGCCYAWRCRLLLRCFADFCHWHWWRCQSHHWKQEEMMRSQHKLHRFRYSNHNRFAYRLFFLYARVKLILPQLSKPLIVVYYGVWLDDTMFGIFANILSSRVYFVSCLDVPTTRSRAILC